MYKIAFLDIDGTILSPEKKEITKNVVEVIKNLENKGVNVCLNTGRCLARAMPIINQLKVKSLVSTLDGICIYDPVKDKIVYENKMQTNTISKIIEIANKHEAFIEVCGNYKDYRYLGKFSDLDYSLDADENVLEYIDNCDSLYNKVNECVELIIAANDRTLSIIINDINKAIEKDIMLREFLWNNYLFISAENSGKAKGMEFICNYYNISPSEAVAVGDYYNDLDMLSEAGMGVAMGNAPNDVKATADYVTDSVENDGVAKALIHFFG